MIIRIMRFLNFMNLSLILMIIFLVIMTIDTYTFSGNVFTFIGATALFATPLLLYWIFRSFYSSPLNK